MPPTFSTDRNPLTILLRFVIVVAIVVVLAAWGIPTYARYQARQNAANQIQLNALRIQQTQQLVEVEKQKSKSPRPAASPRPRESSTPHSPTSTCNMRPSRRRRRWLSHPTTQPSIFRRAKTASPWSAQ